MREDKSKRWQTALKLLLLAVIVGLITSGLDSGPAVDTHTYAPGVRKPMPHFEYRDLSGATWKLDEQRGKVVLVNFWATWCPPCRRETPDLVKLSQQYSQEEFVIIGISLDDGTEQVHRFISQFDVPYPVVMPGENDALSAQIQSLPTSILVDPEGRIARMYVGAVSASQLRKDLQQLFGEFRPTS